MNSQTSKQITVFWSWQNDSPANENRYFIEDCLKRAAKKIGREDAILIDVDRDTKGIGGTPSIADAIFNKIRASDVFVWDATLVYSQPRYAPNPNVLIELGYALAAMGDCRLIGVMNVAGRPGGDELPFDLKHRRWPITYSLDLNSVADQNIKSDVRDRLVNDLANALRDALKEPKGSLFLSDVDLFVAKVLWKIIDSRWLVYWTNSRINHPQVESSEGRDLIYKYIDAAEQPENEFCNGPLKNAHDVFLNSLKDYARIAVIEMSPDGPNAYTINVKRSGFRKDYDKEYDRQVDALVERLEKILDAWKFYIEELRVRYPELAISGAIE